MSSKNVTRKRTGTGELNGVSNEQASASSSGPLELSADAVDLWQEWFRNAFGAIQQIACRNLAKEWIRLIHPKKQSSHPYTGRMPGQEKGSPEDTKPPYWPRDVQHREPDHINKEERVALLVHLVMNTPHPETRTDGAPPKLFPAAAVLAALKRNKEKYSAAEWDSICQIFDIRSQLEHLSGTAESPSPIIQVPDYARGNLKKSKRQRTNDSQTPAKSRRGSEEGQKDEGDAEPLTGRGGDVDSLDSVLTPFYTNSPDSSFGITGQGAPFQASASTGSGSTGPQSGASFAPTTFYAQTDNNLLHGQYAQWTNEPELLHTLIHPGNNAVWSTDMYRADPSTHPLHLAQAADVWSAYPDTWATVGNTFEASAMRHDVEVQHPFHTQPIHHADDSTLVQAVETFRQQVRQGNAHHNRSSQSRHQHDRTDSANRPSSGWTHR